MRGWILLAWVWALLGDGGGWRGRGLRRGLGGCEGLLAMRNGRARCLRRAAQSTSVGGLPIVRYRGGILGNTLPRSLGD